MSRRTNGIRNSPREEILRDLAADYPVSWRGRSVGRRIEAVEALRQIEEGVYGTCMECGSPISTERLRVKPEAIRCIVCQREYESRTVRR